MTNEELILQLLQEIREKLDAQNGRVRRLENWRSFIVGGMSLIAFLMLIMIPMLWDLVIQI